MKEKLFSLEVINAIEEGKIASKQELNNFKLRVAEKFGLSQLPSDPDILAFAESPSKKLIQLLSIKPVRSLSGVSVVAVMCKPLKCPGKCIYCPGSLVEASVPKSYTGKEPAAMRAINAGFDSFQQVSDRLRQLKQTGHSTEKIELIVMGGTFPAASLPYQKKFVLGCLNAVTGKRFKKLESAKRFAEKSSNRLTGLTFETRPDFCGKKEINRMLSFGGTRVELGVQSIDDAVYKKINRGHSVKDVINATQLLKDSAFKICFHVMPGLYFSDLKKDLKNFKKLFSDSDFMPDALKIYPCLVIKGTKLFDLWKKKRFEPISTDEAIDFILKAKKFVPKWARIMRIQRDIPSNVVSAGVDRTNLRQMVHEKMPEKGIKCNCIRCREIGHNFSALPLLKDIELNVESYDASKGKEFFISFDDTASGSLIGFCRLRFPFKPFRKEIDSSTALIRELRVFGQALPLTARDKKQWQHKGLGIQLLQEAERIAKEEMGADKMTIIAGLGVKEYYRKFFGCKDDGFFVSKKL